MSRFFSFVNETTSTDHFPLVARCCIGIPSDYCPTKFPLAITKTQNGSYNNTVKSTPHYPSWIAKAFFFHHTARRGAAGNKGTSPDSRGSPFFLVGGWLQQCLVVLFCCGLTIEDVCEVDWHLLMLTTTGQ